MKGRKGKRMITGERRKVADGPQKATPKADPSRQHQMRNSKGNTKVTIKGGRDGMVGGGDGEGGREGELGSTPSLSLFSLSSLSLSILSV